MCTSSLVVIWSAFALAVAVPIQFLQQPSQDIVDKHLPFGVISSQHYHVFVGKDSPVKVNLPLPEPYLAKKKVPFFIKVRVNKPHPVYAPKVYKVFVDKKIPYIVDKPVPYKVRIPIEKKYLVHYSVEREVPFPIIKEIPYQVKVPVEKPVPYKVEKLVPHQVEKVVPYPVVKEVPYPVKVPYRVEVKVPYTVKFPMDEEYSNETFPEQNSHFHQEDWKPNNQTEAIFVQHSPVPADDFGVLYYSEPENFESSEELDGKNSGTWIHGMDGKNSVSSVNSDKN